jgi:sulfite oxidase
VIDESALVVHRRDSAGRPQMAETRLEHLGRNGGTPADELFLVHHYDPPPEKARELRELILTPLSGSSVRLSPDQVSALREHHVEAVLECAGNGRRALRPPAPGTQFGHGLCAVATWTGVRLRDLLAAHGVAVDAATTVEVHAIDSGWAQPENVLATFGKGLPIDKALHPDTLLAWAVNGLPLPHEHGGPLRLVVPGWAGVWWVKWVHEIRCTDRDFHGFWQNERYRYVGGAFGEPVVVTKQLPRALIVSPREGDVVQAGSVEVTGRAWSGGGRIALVDVSFDGGATWTEAELEPQASDWTWVTWTSVGELPADRAAVVCARATDSQGDTQQWDSRRNDLGYGNNGVMQVCVRARAGSN